MTATPKLFYAYDFVKVVNNKTSPNDDAIDDFLVPSSGQFTGAPSTLGVHPDTTTNDTVTGLAMDPAAGVYFISSRNGSVSSIYEEKIGQAPQYTTALFTNALDKNPGDDLTSLALNPADDLLYFVDGTKFEEVQFSPNSFTPAKTPTQLATLTLSASGSDEQLAFDRDDDTAYFAVPQHGTQIITITQKTKPGPSHPNQSRTSGGSYRYVTTKAVVTSNYIYMVSGVKAGAQSNSLGSGTPLNLGGPDGLPFSDGVITGVTEATVGGTQTLYIVTKSGGTSTSNTAGIYAYQLSGVSKGTLTTIFKETITTSTASLTDMTYITVDPATGEYYVSDSEESKTPGIYEGNVANLATTQNPDGVAPTLLYAVTGPMNGEASGDFTSALAIDSPATVVAGATVTFDGGQASPVVLDTGLTVTDIDSQQLASAKVTIASDFVSGDKLNFTNQNNITGAYNATTGVLTLTGTDSVANYQAALRSVSYSFTPANGDPTGGNADTSRTIDWTVDDGVLSSTTVTSTLDVVHEQPTVTAGASAIFDGGQSSPTALDTGLTASAPDSGGVLKGAKVTIASGSITGDTLTFTNQNGISGSYDPSTKVLSLTGSASVTNYQIALESVGYKFAPTNGDPTGGGSDTSRTIDWTVNDGVVNSTVATSTLNVVHEPPVVTAGASANYSGIGSPVTLDGGLNVNDPDSADDLTSATVQISSGFLAGDTLQVGTPEAGISAIYNPATGELALSGSASIAAYQTELESITYSSLTSDATNGGADTSRTITWTVGDGVSNSTPATSSLTVAPCYCRGARILTDRGEVAVEALRIGDLAITASGARRPIVWLGYRRLDLTRHNNPTAVWPVRVAANAFGEGLPHRDLWLSPGHNVASEGVLMPISSLINGQSVAQIKQSAVEYWHVELDAHDILIAEGLATESYLDCGNRAAFANGGAFIDAHPDFAPKYWAETCLPLIKQGPAVTATKARLLARLATEGHCIVREADAHIVVDGLRVEPFRASEMRLAFALPAGGQEIVLRSNVFVPAHTIDESVDSRELGLCVRKLQIDGSTAALDCDEACAAGWREAEYLDGNFARRWTTGATPLPAGSRGVIVDLAGVGYYWLTPAEQVAALSA